MSVARTTHSRPLPACIAAALRPARAIGRRFSHCGAAWTSPSSPPNPSAAAAHRFPHALLPPSLLAHAVAALQPARATDRLCPSLPARRCHVPPPSSPHEPPATSAHRFPHAGAACHRPPARPSRQLPLSVASRTLAPHAATLQLA
jgi:hypothetical protein